MIEKIEPELINDSFLNSLMNNLIPIQDKINIDLDKPIITNNIVKNEKDYIIQKNKFFFIKFEKLYTNNILLKSKLNDMIEEKKRLNQLIIKLEQQINNSKKSNKEIDRFGNNNKSSVIESYKKKKRKRRKKSEIKNIFNCPFHNCNKSYPSKGSLNMHIKLKHSNQKQY